MIDIYDFIEAESYSDIAHFAKLFGAIEDIDYLYLIENGLTTWSTKLHGDITISIEFGNVDTIIVRDDFDRMGKCSTYDHDAYGIVGCLYSALNDYWKDCQNTYVNEPIPVGGCMVSKTECDE